MKGIGKAFSRCDLIYKRRVKEGLNDALLIGLRTSLQLRLACRRVCGGKLEYIQQMLTPHRSNLESLDPEYEDYSRNFAALEVETEKLLKDTTVFTEAVVST